MGGTLLLRRLRLKRWPPRATKRATTRHCLCVACLAIPSCLTTLRLTNWPHSGSLAYPRRDFQPVIGPPLQPTSVTPSLTAPHHFQHRQRRLFDFRYSFDGSEAVQEVFNTSVTRSTPDANANANSLRKDSVRWIPKVNREFSIPVLTPRTLGDVYVPFIVEPTNLQSAAAKGSSANLVQRAIRAPGHCDFTVAEQLTAFADLVKWLETGVKPAGDDVLSTSVAAHPNYGCAHADNTVGVDDAPLVKTWRTKGKLPACN